ncbi:helix-turn-helix domain-containing protein [Allocoprobacillus halotolerans]
MRKKYKCSQKTFATLLGISERTLRKYEKDEIEPSESVKLKLFELKD